MECLVVSAQPTSGPTEASLFPPAGAGDHVLGPETAETTFIEYTDYQVPASAALDLVLDQLAQKYPQSVRRVFRPFPLPNSDKALQAAIAAEAAAKQGKFWELSRLLIEGQPTWTALQPEAFADWLNLRAKELNLDMAQFAADLQNAEIKAKVIAGQQFGLTRAIPVMPFLLVNGRIYQGPRDLRSLESLVSLSRMEARQFTDCPDFVIDLEKQYVAELQTSKGTILLNLFPKQAPYAVNNFVFLARKGWYDGVSFHRVVKNEIAQSGDPSGSGYGSPGYAFVDEISTLRFDRPGVLAMANAGPNSNGSQFFITYRAMPEIDGKMTIFGSVLEGMDVLNALTERDPSQPQIQPDGDVIEKVVIREQ
jgi:cyclophilin family peptidyl-prolyl cis-trans isomerase/protein-disulfide isomerase